MALKSWLIPQINIYINFNLSIKSLTKNLVVELQITKQP